MTRRRDAFDEQDDALPGDLRAQFDELAARHRADPPSDVLRAADAEALPPPAQASLAAGLAASRWQQGVVRSTTAASEEAALDPDSADRLLARIRREVEAHDVARRAAIRWRVFGVIGFAAALVILTTAVVVRRPAPQQVPEEARALPSSAVATVPPVFRIPLTAAPVKLTARALVLRSDGREASFADEAAPAFDAYRAGNYHAAAEAFARIAPRYPASIEVPFYLGVSRLMTGDAPGAATVLQAARALDDPTFRDDVAWYLAIAAERSGDAATARASLAGLCTGSSPRAARACDAAAALREP